MGKKGRESGENYVGEKEYPHSQSRKDAEQDISPKKDRQKEKDVRLQGKEGKFRVQGACEEMHSNIAHSDISV